MPLFIYLLIHLVFSACSSSITSGILRERDACHYHSFSYNSLLIINLLLSVCSSSMRQASCWSCHFLILYLFFFYDLVPPAAVCMRYPADDASHYYFIYHLFIIYHLVPAVAVCVKDPAAP
jgi:hypothetical protein